jgi:hypothetical protein
LVTIPKEFQFEKCKQLADFENVNNYLAGFENVRNQLIL